MTKDRLAEFQSRSATSWPHKNLRRSSRESHNRIVAENSDDESAREVLIPMDDRSKQTEFFAQVDLIRTMIEKISTLSEEIRRIHSDIVQPTADEKLARNLDERNEDIKKLSREIPLKLKKLEKELLEETTSRKHMAHGRIRQLQIFNLTQHFRDVMVQYNNQAIAHRLRCIGLIRTELEIAGFRVSDEEIEKMVDENFPGRLKTTLLIDIKNAKEALQTIESRHRDILKLEVSIKELHDMFCDLQTLVTTQGGMIDNIEYNVNTAVNCTNAGGEHIRDAKKSKEAQRRKKICVGIILIIVAVVIMCFLFTYITVQKKFFGR